MNALGFWNALKQSILQENPLRLGKKTTQKLYEVSETDPMSYVSPSSNLYILIFFKEFSEELNFLEEPQTD